MAADRSRDQVARSDGLRGFSPKPGAANTSGLGLPTDWPDTATARERPTRVAYRAYPGTAGGEEVTADQILHRLDRVRRVGTDRWVACCPAHDSKSRSSLSIRELDDGRVLVHDHGGCSVQDVLSAVGLEIEVLFPEKPIGDRVSRVKKPYRLRDVVAALKGELHIAWVVLSDVKAKKPITENDAARAKVAVERISLFLREIDHAG